MHVHVHVISIQLVHQTNQVVKAMKCLQSELYAQSLHTIWGDDVWSVFLYPRIVCNSNRHNRN